MNELRRATHSCRAAAADADAAAAAAEDAAAAAASPALPRRDRVEVFSSLQKCDVR